LTHDVVPGKPGNAARRRDRRRQDADGRRLAGAVGAEQSEHLARGDLEVDSVHCPDVSGVSLGQPGDLDRRHRHGRLDGRHGVQLLCAHLISLSSRKSAVTTAASHSSNR